MEITLKDDNNEFTETSLCGHVRYTDLVASNFERERFINALEALMNKHGVIKIDVCFDPFKFHKIKNKQE